MAVAECRPPPKCPTSVPAYPDVGSDQPCNCIGCLLVCRSDGPVVSALMSGSKWSECHETNSLSYHHLLSPRHLNRLCDMEKRKFLSLPKTSRRTQGKVRSEVGFVEEPMEVDPVARRPTESTPDLGLGPSTLSTSGLSTSGDQESGGMRINFHLIVHSTYFLSCNSDRNAAPGLVRSVSRKGKRNRTNTSDDTADPRAASKGKKNLKSLASSAAKLTLRGAKEAADAFPPLKSAAAALCFILENCEVRSISSALPDFRCSRFSQNTTACRRTIESLIPRVKELGQSLSTPAPPGEVKEEGRRRVLEW